MTFHISKTKQVAYCGRALNREPMYFPADRVTVKVLDDIRTCKACIEKWREG